MLSCVWVSVMSFIYWGSTWLSRAQEVLGTMLVPSCGSCEGEHSDQLCSGERHWPLLPMLPLDSPPLCSQSWAPPGLLPASYWTRGGTDVAVPLRPRCLWRETLSQGLPVGLAGSFSDLCCLFLLSPPPLPSSVQGSDLPSQVLPFILHRQLPQ